MVLATSAPRVCRLTAAFGNTTALRAAVPRVQSRRARQLTRMGATDYDKVSSAYASALVELAQEKNALDTVHADVDSLQAAMRETPDVKEFLFNPMVDVGKKRDLLSSLANDAGLSKHTLNFLNLLLDSDRLVAVESIFDEFQAAYCRLTDTQVATLRSAVRMEQENQFLIAKKLQELTGSKNIKLKPVIDESLIAGFVIEFGSSQIDLSVKGRLEKVEAELYKQQALAS